MADEPITGMYEMLEALEDALKSADSAKREVLAKTIDAYHGDFPEDVDWALGAQSPTLLYHLFMSITGTCRQDGESKPRSVPRLVDHKPEGSA